MVAEFRVKSKLVSSDFPMMKNIVAPSSLSSLSMKLIFILNQSFLIQFVCLNLLQLVGNALKSVHNLINY